ncbi:aquaporin family protein [Desulfosporosinus fructosivorans]|uniref:Aquaporin family protein n=1 Tax=Desulfosporosinus fructosivorans TaxID=2018669 RepID=A0A4Z0R0X3_9FIRM|nr:MIP/aquaporin family protein [Desulfosporosinus fructosivorans]TGE35627.1 aquaporin family protein [Desulfosporosinus fructosivorans]
MTNLLGEFIGTLVLLSFGVGSCANLTLKDSKGEGGGGGGAWIAVTTGWAFGVVLGVFTAIALGAPQADLNPAITLAKTMLGVYTPGHALITMLVQVAGGLAGAAVAWLIYLPHWKITEDKAAKMGCFCTAPAIRTPIANLITETVVTLILVFLVFVIFSKDLSDGGAKFATGFGPYLVGILVWGLGLAFGGPTGYAINPARDLGPRIAHAILPMGNKASFDWGYAWIPIVGPMFGAVLAVIMGKTFGIL